MTFISLFIRGLYFPKYSFIFLLLDMDVEEQFLDYNGRGKNKNFPLFLPFSFSACYLFSLHVPPFSSFYFSFSLNKAKISVVSVNIAECIIVICIIGIIRVPYLCEGDLSKSVYSLNDFILVFKHK